MTDDPASETRCSAKGCTQPAAYALLWRNPRIHSAERVKQWLACPQHRDSLSDFLARRDFPLRVEALDRPGGPGPGPR